MTSETAIKREVALVKRVAEHLGPHGWKPINIGISLHLFRKTHGSDALAAMDRFIDWCEANDKTEIIVPTLGHDLNGCEDALMCPRTSSY